MYGPLIILGVSIVFVVAAITVLRLHAFLALSLGAILVAVLSAFSSAGPPALGAGVELAMTEMGLAMGKIALPIALAAVNGACLLESGAADRIVRTLVSTLGEKRTDLALLGSGFFMSIPVFFDTVFFLLIPIAQALALRTGRNYLLYLLVICGGGVITHSTIPPTPGPLLVAETLQLDLGFTILAGVACAVPIAGFALWLSRWLNVKIPVLWNPASRLPDDRQALPEVHALPSFKISILPIVLPILLIGSASFGKMGLSEGAVPGWWPAVEFLANKNIAMLLGALTAAGILLHSRRLGARSLADRLAPSLETAGVIILITSAGGAYGAMIKHSGLGESIAALADGRPLNHVLLAWLLAATIRVAQGSATVAMITAAGIMHSIAATTGWGCHPFYVYLALGYGAFFLSWMNDSGFWLVSRMGRLTEMETLKSWTVLLSLLSLAGLLQALVLSAIFPLRPA